MLQLSEGKHLSNVRHELPIHLIPMQGFTFSLINKLLFIIGFSGYILLNACDAGRPLLNSERIEQRFGNYAVEVLRRESELRISNLYSERSGLRTCRTYAIVTFAQPVDLALAALHADIESGRSIGATLRDAGWEVSKRLKYIGKFPVTDADDEIVRLMRIEVPRSLALHNYDVEISKAGRTINYATIVEIHHPDYLTVAELRRIYGDNAAERPPPPLIPGQ